MKTLSFFKGKAYAPLPFADYCLEDGEEHYATFIITPQLQFIVNNKYYLTSSFMPYRCHLTNRRLIFEPIDYRSLHRNIDKILSKFSHPAFITLIKLLGASTGLTAFITSMLRVATPFGLCVELPLCVLSIVAIGYLQPYRTARQNEEVRRDTFVTSLNDIQNIYPLRNLVFQGGVRKEIYPQLGLGYSTPYIYIDISNDVNFPLREFGGFEVAAPKENLPSNFSSRRKKILTQSSKDFVTAVCNALKIPGFEEPRQTQK